MDNNKSTLTKSEIRELKKMYLIMSLEWDSQKNGAIPSRNEIQDNAYRTVAWKCPYCGVTWEDQICNRLRGEKPCSCHEDRVKPESEMEKMLQLLKRN